jgi:hypothetical protein
MVYDPLRITWYCVPCNRLYDESEMNEPDLGRQLSQANARIDELEYFIMREGYTRCDIAACNCGSYHGGRWKRLYDTAKERIAELEASVSRLPKTADGVIAEHGMRVWYPGDREYGTVTFHVCEEIGYNSINKCFSTREAAEKAGESV